MAITQRRAAELLGTDEATISRWLASDDNGRVPSLGWLDKISKIFQRPWLEVTDAALAGSSTEERRYGWSAYFAELLQEFDEGPGPASSSDPRTATGRHLDPLLARTQPTIDVQLPQGEADERGPSDRHG